MTMLNTPKSAYFNIKMKKPKKPTLNVDYVVINQLTKFKWTKGWWNNSLAYMLGKRNKKWLRGGLLKIKSKFCPSKVHRYLLLQIVVIKIKFMDVSLTCFICWTPIQHLKMKGHWKVQLNFHTYLKPQSMVSFQNSITVCLPYIFWNSSLFTYSYSSWQS